MKTLVTLLIFTITINVQTFSQRNTGGDRTPPKDRIDKVNGQNPERNPIPHREPIQNPQRIKEQQPIVIYNPEPETHKPVYHPHPPTPIEGPPYECPQPYPDPPIIIYNEPNLDDYSLAEVLERGIFYLDSEEYNEAIKCFNHLLKNDPLDYEIYTLRGRAYHGLEFYDKAKKDFQKSIRIEKSFADAYYYLGLTEIELGDIDAAKVDFELAAELGNEKAIQLMKKYFYQ